MTKKCTSCDVEKPLLDFPRDKYQKDGHTTACKLCRYTKTNIWLRNRYSTDKDEVLRMNAEYRKNNWSKVYAKRCEPSNRAGAVLHLRLTSALKRGISGNFNKEMEYLGCSMKHFMSILESKFYEDMSWENYGAYWHIDHIRPRCSFDLTKDEDKKICFHYSNLQPLTAKDNMSKGSKYKESSKACKLC